MLTQLRKKLRNIKRRKFVTEKYWRDGFSVDTAVFFAERSIRELEEAFKQLDRLEKQYWKNKKQDKATTNKLAGQNFLRPRLGR